MVIWFNFTWLQFGWNYFTTLAGRPEDVHVQDVRVCTGCEGTFMIVSSSDSKNFSGVVCFRLMIVVCW